MDTLDIAKVYAVLYNYYKQSHLFKYINIITLIIDVLDLSTNDMENYANHYS